MKTILILFTFAVFSFNVHAQSQVDTFIKEAQGYLTNKDYKQAQLSLQDAINEINRLMSDQVLALLANEINGYKSDGDGDINTAGMAMMGGGMQITKNYRHPSNSQYVVEVQIMANSPLLSSMSMYMNNPSIMGPNYKSVRVGTMRAVLKSDMQEIYDDNGESKNARSSELQIPMGQTLILIKSVGLASEQEEIAFATKLELDKIKIVLGE